MSDTEKCKEVHTGADMMRIRDEGLRELCAIIAGMTSARDVEDFFGCLFTEAEREDLAKRWLLVREIDRGTTQRKIARMFKMSLCKITRGAKELKKDGSAFRKVLDLLKSDSLKKERLNGTK